MKREPFVSDPGFEGIGDFGSDDPYERWIAHQAALGQFEMRGLQVLAANPISAVSTLYAHACQAT
jgi:hypothetical protein